MTVKPAGDTCEFRISLELTHDKKAASDNIFFFSLFTFHFFSYLCTMKIIVEG